jgi:hypothetical protein
MLKNKIENKHIQHKKIAKKRSKLIGLTCQTRDPDYGSNWIQKLSNFKIIFYLIICQPST